MCVILKRVSFFSRISKSTSVQNVNITELLCYDYNDDDVIKYSNNHNLKKIKRRFLNYFAQ